MTTQASSLFGCCGMQLHCMKLSEQCLLSRFDMREIGFLDMAKAAQLERQAGQLDSRLVICRR